jgi:DNA invertase Pin-like site-specific DNA recombinase
MVRPLKRFNKTPHNPYQADPLPVGLPAAVYYRQSSEAQIGNISTTLQTVDMIDHLIRLGWSRENTIMIDMDAGVSGTRKISERKGMSYLLDLIEKGSIALVAAQDVDRFFRDLTQIETNIFIDACRRNRVQVMTPNVVYDFAHHTMGSYFMKMFRDEAQRAADFIEYHIRGRLMKSRHHLSEQGLWSGRQIPPGFLVDMRSKLSNGETNPSYRKYTHFAIYADVMQIYFELFKQFNGNLQGTWKHIHSHGPFFPEPNEIQIPSGFLMNTHFKHRSKENGKLCPSMPGLQLMLTNVTYLGHWIHQQSIVVWNNHPSIIANDLFMFAFNRLSPYDFYGEANPYYVPYRPYNRHDKTKRPVDPPAYSGLVFSDDLPNEPHRRLHTSWKCTVNRYRYCLPSYPPNTNKWTIRSDIVDDVIHQLLFDRLKSTTIDANSWQTALVSMKRGETNGTRRIKAAIKRAQQTKENLIASLASLTHPEMVKRAQEQYEVAERELEIYYAQLDKTVTSERQLTNLAQAHLVLSQILNAWEKVTSSEKRALFEQFARYVNIQKSSNIGHHITVLWRDNTTSSIDVAFDHSIYFWSDANLQTLKLLIDTNEDQINIMRIFPRHTWRALQQRYAYVFGNGKFPTNYKGKRQFKRNTRWVDTDEYQASLKDSDPSHLPTSYAVIQRC